MKSTTSMLTPLAEGLWVARAPQSFLGLEIGTRMTVVRLSDGGLFIHSPVPLTRDLQTGLEELGEVRAVVAPNRYHHLYVRDFVDRYPGACIYAAPGLPEKRRDIRFHGVLQEEAPSLWNADLDQILLEGMPLLRDVVFYHATSRTLILTDLCFNYPPAESFWLRFYRRNIQDYDGKFTVARFIKLFVRDRQALRASCDRILEWDFDRVTVTHGEVLESGGKEAFRTAVEWL